jgi:hypothetical protein
VFCGKLYPHVDAVGRDRKVRANAVTSTLIGQARGCK